MIPDACGVVRIPKQFVVSEKERVGGIACFWTAALDVPMLLESASVSTVLPPPKPAQPTRPAAYFAPLASAASALSWLKLAFPITSSLYRFP